MHFLPLLRTIAAALTVAAMLAGCQAIGHDSLIPSTVTVELSPSAVGAIAADMADHLTQFVGPSKTTIVLNSTDGSFGQALEAALKGRGYAIATGETAEGTEVTPLAYLVDPFSENVLVRLSTPTLDLTRVYRTDARGAIPASPISVRQNGTGGTS